jgi:DNA-binding transcriptional LysR family regulator
LDRLESMSVLLATAEFGSLSAASRALGIPLTSVSRKISELERYLNAQLLNRSSRRLVLTEAGRSYVTVCRRILEEIKEAERGASGEYRTPQGDLTVTAPIVFGRLHVLPVAIAFLKAYREIDIRMVLADRLFNLLEERVDVAARIGPLPDSGLRAHRIGSIRQVVCASPAYFAKRGVPKTPLDLRDHDCVAFEGLSSPSGWTFAVGKAKKAIAIRPRLRVNTAEAAIDAAIGGVGLTRVLSYQVAKAVRTGALEIVLATFEPTAWPINLVHRGEKFVPLKLRAFLDFTVPRLKARLRPIE